MRSAHDIATRGPLIPVLTITDPAHAAPLAEALLAGGVTVLEVTLRTPAALEAIAEMVRTCPAATVGAGTIRNAGQLAAAIGAGAAFGVSPGTTARLADAARESGLPFLPGAATVSEAMALAERGFDVVKFFPAEAAGGAATLKAWQAPLPDLRFCPTGGVTGDNAGRYLALANVACVGGSWIAPAGRVAAADWAGITALARAASEELARLRPG